MDAKYWLDLPEDDVRKKRRIFKASNMVLE